MRPHVFVDETRSGGFLLAAAAVASGRLNEARQAIKGLILPGQRSIHFCKKRDDRRRILGVIRSLDVQVVIYNATRYGHVKLARDASLAGLVTDAAKIDAERLVFELDDSVLKADRSLLREKVRSAGVESRLRYDHMRSHEECLLSIPDAVAWSWARGAEWRAGVRPVVTDLREV
ncbi:hypothetical protein GCM10027280_33780 [Micromonospora polyrhachis]|uniref:DUF3800 domain-containing protein n=1 Tax=Micromonospora polyrhachis TaxID=1282883 RepID=A0A7W7STP3_9ACTN|nr:hypothetical protein [Micromonospora polyrhachis]MBB4959550.1 hypothetical protein [Micromonospora polyrhachis]